MSKLLVDEISDADNTGPVTVTDGLTVQGAFTSLGIDDNATSTAMTLDASGNLLVGQTTGTIFNSSSVTGLTAAGTGGLQVAGANATVIYANRQGSDGAILGLYKDGTTMGSIGTKYDAGIYVGSNHSGFLFNNSVDKYVQPYSVGSNSLTSGELTLGSAGYRFKDLYLSGGVYLGGTGAANKLDDYEEGTWDPTWGGDVTDPTISYLNQSGWYVKVGSLVWCGGTIQINSASGGSGNLLIRSFPFTCASDQVNEVSTMCVGYVNNFSTYYPTAGYMGRNRTFVNISAVDVSTNTALMQTSYLTSSSYINFSITYTTD